MKGEVMEFSGNDFKQELCAEQSCFSSINNAKMLALLWINAEFL
jgi:hypothetical protein